MPPSKRPVRDDASRGDAGDKPAEKSDSPDAIFDVDYVRRLVDLMEERDLGEIELRSGEKRIRLRRGPESAQPYVVTQAPAVSPTAPPPTAGGAEKTSGVSGAAEGANIAVIKSPMVGTFYSRPNPNAAPFVKPGDHVNAETTVCIIEAMKVFNEIPAETRGRIVAVLVGDGEAVDHGKPLFKIDTAG